MFGDVVETTWVHRSVTRSFGLLMENVSYQKLNHYSRDGCSSVVRGIL
jgi:hypothetical protein